MHFLCVAVEASENQFLFGADAHDAAFFRDGAGDVLANPPHGVADKLDFLGAIKTSCSLDEAHVAFVDEFHDVEALASVKIGYVDNETQVGVDEHVHGGLIAFAGLLKNDFFLFLGKQRVFGDIVQVLRINILLISSVCIHRLPRSQVVYVNKSTIVSVLHCHFRE